MTIPERITERLFRLVSTFDAAGQVQYDEVTDSQPVVINIDGETPPCPVDLHARPDVDEDEGEFWEVFDGITGLRVLVADTLEEAVAAADAKVGTMLRIRPVDYLESVNHFVTSYGLSPRYDRNKLDDIEWLESYKGDGHSIKDYLAEHPELVSQ